VRESKGCLQAGYARQPVERASFILVVEVNKHPLSPPILEKHNKFAFIADPEFPNPVGVFVGARWRVDHDLAVSVYAGGHAQNGLDFLAGHALLDLSHVCPVKLRRCEQGSPQSNASQEHA